jgi:hypothetical protein
VTGQRDVDDDGVPDARQSVAAGETIGDREWRSMCWLVDGVIEKSVPTDPASADVPAKVPDGRVPPAADLLPPPGAPPGVGLDCKKNQ